MVTTRVTDQTRDPFNYSSNSKNSSLDVALNVFGQQLISWPITILMTLQLFKQAKKSGKKILATIVLL